MFIERAFAEREKLTDNDLLRLRAALADQVAKYQETIENYPADRLAKHGIPHLTALQSKVSAVDDLVKKRARS